MFDSANCLAGSDAICVVGIGIIVKGLKLSAFFPRQRVSKVAYGISLRVICNNLVSNFRQQVFPNIVSILQTVLGYFLNLSILINNIFSNDVAIVV